MERETARQLFHMAVGIVAIALLLSLGRGAMIFATFLIIIVGMLLINLRLLGFRIPIVQEFESRFERTDAPLPGWGSACYAVGVLLTLTLLHSTGQIAAVIFILAVGDGVSTIVGSRGRMKIPYNTRKTAEGSAALFLSGLLAYFFVGPVALPLSLVAALAETVPRVDDNLSIPIACTALLMVL